MFSFLQPSNSCPAPPGLGVTGRGGWEGSVAGTNAPACGVVRFLFVPAGFFPVKPVTK